MKKKLAMTILTLVMSIAVLTGGTLAWFTHQQTAGTTEFTAGTVKIQAGQCLAFSDSEGGGMEWVEGEIYPKRVVDSEQGPAGDGKPVKAARSNPNAVLAYENNVQDESFFSLGFGGYVVVEFDQYIYPGKDDFVQIATIVETTQGNYPPEKAEVYLSANGRGWVYIGEVDNTGSGSQLKKEVEIPKDLDLAYARYIKVKDISNPDDFLQDSTADGFDVNAIYVKGAYQSGDFNWNPGDSTVRKYYVINTGTKNIRLRGEFKLKWFEYDEESRRWVDWTEPGESVVTIGSKSNNWHQKEEYFYYKGVVPGTYTEADKEPRTVTLPLSIQTAGAAMDNEYQGKRFVITGSFEAIQASNGAAEEVWDVKIGN